MPVTVGDELGPYQIVALIGAGGMGEVYKARDPRLGRDVAIKVSAERFTERFGREARAIASLNHPNICSLYDVGPNYLVMELVEGPTLAEKIKRAALPLEEGLALARQIMDALEVAHEKGIVHRDLKPGNIKIKPDGLVKVLDFGLAKIAPAAAGNLEEGGDFSTWTIDQTQAGMVLGTAPYMAPEQALGQTVDKRADIWAFGVVLYEMLTGRRLFRGSTISETLAAVLKEEPDWERAPAMARGLLRSCLKKDPKQRLRDIADAKLLLVEDAPVERARRGWLWPAVAGAVLLVLAPANLRYFRKAPTPAGDQVRFQITPPDDNRFDIYLSLSPDGRNVAFTAVGGDGVTRLWVRPVDALKPRLLPGTDGAASPFWSPDSRFIAFSAGSRLRKVEALGASPAQTVCDVPGGATAASGAWNADGVILFGTRGRGSIHKVSDTGGAVTDVTAVDASRAETIHAFPWFLPDQKHFVYFRNSGDASVQGEYIGSLDAKPAEQPSKRILPAQYGSVFVPSADQPGGRLLFLREGTLMVQPFDVARLDLTGEPTPVAEQVATTNVYGHFSASANGAVAYRSGFSGGDRQLVWYDRKGAVTTREHRGGYLELALSPDGKQAAAYQLGQQDDLWLLDFVPPRSQRFTFDDVPNRYPIWSADGRQIAFCTGVGSTARLFKKGSANTGEPEELLPSACPQDWSRDGRFILYTGVGSGNPADLWILPLTTEEGDLKPRRFLTTPFTEYQARFSPDGRWIAYVSNESGPYEVYVRPFVPAKGSDSWAGEGKWQISSGGGHQPRWSGDGRQLMYLSSTGKLMSVDVSTAGGSFTHGSSKAVFDIPIFGGADYQSLTALWDMTKDGQHFLVTTQAGASNYAPINFVQNLFPGK